MTKDPIMKWTDSRLEELEKRIAEAYKKAEAEITAKMQAYLDKFAKQDAVMAQKWKSGEITKKEYVEWRTNHFMIGKNWQAVKDTIAGDVLKTDLISAKLVNDALVDVYTQNANYAYYQLEKDTGTGLSFDLYDKKAVENLLKDDPDFIPHYEPKTPIVERWNKQHIQSEMLQGILQGESIPKIAKRMSNVTDMDKNASIRNARTYTTSVENQAKMDRYAEAEDAGIPLEKEWLSTLDERTRESHREIDGTRVANDEPFILINSNGSTCEMMYPADPNGDPEQVYNCRCRIVARIKGRTVDRSGRTSKLEDKTYEEWKKGKEKEQATTEDKGNSWADRIKELREAGKTDTESIMEAGRLISEQIHGDYLDKVKEEREQLKTNYEEAKDKYDKVRKEFDDIRWSDEYTNAKYISEGKADVTYSKYFGSQEEAEKYYQENREKLEELNVKRKEYWDEYKNAFEKYVNPDYTETAEYLKNTLSQVREMGTGDANIKEHLSNTRSKVRENIEWAYNNYPTEWVQQSVDHSDLSVKKVSRGYYNNPRRIIAISGEGDSANRTSVHELGHRFEYTVDGIREAEKEFYEKRTDGEQPVWLGKGYGRDEVTRKDDFIDPYMGKDYNGRAYELVSMGFECAYCDPAKLAQDADMEAWIYGLLALK